MGFDSTVGIELSDSVTADNSFTLVAGRSSFCNDGRPHWKVFAKSNFIARVARGTEVLVTAVFAAKWPAFRAW